MNLNIIGAGSAHSSEYQELMGTPAYRKATKNMALAMLALEKSLSPIHALFDSRRERFGLVFTSQTGELETTLEFLKTLNEQKLARPLLFQNSLHNSTAGFVAIQAKITGPVISISPNAFNEESALEMAQTLLAAKQCDYCIVLSSNIFPHWDQPGILSREVTDAASCVILSNDFSSEVASMGHIKEMKIMPSTKPITPAAWQSTAQSQNILSVLVKDLIMNRTGKIHVDHPQWGTSSLTWKSEV